MVPSTGLAGKQRTTIRLKFPDVAHFQYFNKADVAVYGVAAQGRRTSYESLLYILRGPLGTGHRQLIMSSCGTARADSSSNGALIFDIHKLLTRTARVPATTWR